MLLPTHSPLTLLNSTLMLTAQPLNMSASRLLRPLTHNHQPTRHLRRKSPSQHPPGNLPKLSLSQKNKNMSPNPPTAQNPPHFVSRLMRTAQLVLLAAILPPLAALAQSPSSAPIPGVTPP